jgi:cell wall-associated NlpC family hydrolase
MRVTRSESDHHAAIPKGRAVRSDTPKMRKIGAFTAACVVLATLVTGPASARQSAIPDWVKPAVNYLHKAGYLDKADFKANKAMTRADFKTLMRKTFGRGHFHRTEGKVTAGEVSKALVKALGQKGVADTLSSSESPDGWKPVVGKYFGTEIVARELGLRHDRSTSEDAFEASDSEVMRQADIAYAVYEAATSPSTYSAEALAGFKLGSYDEARREVVQFALSLVGTPYVWGGEWPKPTPSGYPYGAQVHGGFDCSGFVWYVLRAKADGWKPTARPYKGWAIPERSSYDMAAGTAKKLGYKKLRPGDIMFFAPNGRDSKAKDVYHAGLYLGRGWMIHSSGSRAGISISDVSAGSWWHDQIAWGRRVIK